MMWLDAKYMGLIGHRLRNFKRKGSEKWNFSCPFCGDSTKDKTKARAYVYESKRKGKLNYTCHNCNIPGIDVPKLVKHIDPFLYQDYVKEKLVETGRPREKSEVEIFADKMKTPVFVKNSPLKQLKKISAFRPDSFVKQYVEGRKLPPESHYRLFYAKRFKQWINDACVPGKFRDEDLQYDEPRLIIPFIDPEGKVFGLQGRSFSPTSKLRYITIMIDEDMPKVFGWDKVDVRLPHIYVLEGPLDSLFIPNAIATAGGELTTTLPAIEPDQSKFVIVYDNEPRNVHTIKKMETAIDRGYSICIWPDSVYQKDVNNMVLDGMEPKKVVEIIEQNVYTGLQAKLRLQQWKKV